MSASDHNLIDGDGFRANVGIIIANQERQLFWARRVGRTGWQFPQGGIQANESPRDALFRELAEEVGLAPADVKIIGQSKKWLRYRLPRQYLQHHRQPLCIGQKQRWFLLQLAQTEVDFDLSRSSAPEFDHWTWVDFWQPLNEVIYFKRKVYRKALHELGPLLFPDGMPSEPAPSED